MRFQDRIGLQKTVLRKLAESCLTAKDMKFLGIEVLPADKSPTGRGGFKIWYYDIRRRQSAFYRFRNLEKARGFAALAAGGKDQRYWQPAKLKPRVYFSPLLDWGEALADRDTPLLITEGELKAACATKFELACLGIGGVWNFRSKTEFLIADLAALPLKDRKVFIVFDSDARANPQVAAAENILALEFIKRGARVFICRIPCLPGLKKTALDDFILIKGSEAFRAEMLDKAEEWQVSRALFDFNEKFVHVRNPEMVVRFEDFLMMSPTSFYKSQYSNSSHPVLTAKGEKKEVCTAEAWLKWLHRNEVERLVYEPGKLTIVTDERGRQLLNMWPGWGVEPKKGTVRPFLDLLDQLFEGAQPEYRDWFLKWLAYPLQYPGTKMFSAVLMWGVIQGTGKTILAATMKRIYGDNFASVSETELFDSEFNHWAERKQFIECDEATGGGTENKRRVYAKLKSLITSSDIRVNAKHIRPFTIRDSINFYFTSNLPDCLLFEFSDRRLFVHEVTAQRLPEGWGEKYVQWLDREGGAAALFEYLLSLDLTGFDPFAPPPVTEAKTEMLEASSGALRRWVSELKESPDAKLSGVDNETLPFLVFTARDLFAIYEWQNRDHPQAETSNALAKFLGEFGFVRVPPRPVGNRKVPGLIAADGSKQKAVVWLRPGFPAALPKWATTHAGVARQYNTERQMERAVKAEVNKLDNFGRNALMKAAMTGGLGPHAQRVLQQRQPKRKKS
jgi:hypothetical protein